MFLKKAAVTTVATVMLMIPMAGIASARPCGGEGVCTGSKELCKDYTNWFERYILQMPDFVWVPCKSLKP